MLALPIAVLVGAGPLLGPWSGPVGETALLLSVLAGAGAWLLSRVAVGYLPIPAGRDLAWTAALAALGGLSAALSPALAQAGPGWRSLLLGLFLFPAVAALGKDGRAAVDQAARAAGWVLFLLAGYQRFHAGASPPAGPFPHPEALCGAVLLLLPVAVQVRDWILSAGLLLTLVWSGGLGAWLGLSGALLLSRRSVGEPLYRAGALIGFVVLVVLYARLESPSLLARWQAWSAAAAMAVDHPWSGVGPGAFPVVEPAYLAPGAGPAGAPHQHLLAVAAECGLPYAVLWFGGVLHFLRRGGPHKRFGALAALLQGLYDPSLSVPSNFWLLCYLLACSAPETSRAADIPSSRKLPAAVLSAALVLGTGWPAWDRLQGELLKERALALREGDPAAALSLLEAASRRAPDAETEALRAELEARRGRWEEAARLYGSAAGLDPHRPSYRAALERAKRRAGGGAP